ncbi:MAG: hypothetical protein ACRD5Z_13455 [Bryobacteraceae bacterium]
MPEHVVVTVPRMGWAGVKNGRLLALAEGEFDVLLTVDRNISTQQQLAKFQIGVPLVLARSNRLEDIRPLLPRILEGLKAMRAGALTVVEGSR